MKLLGWTRIEQVVISALSRSLKTKSVFYQTIKTLNACIFVGGISEGVFATLLMPLFCCPKLLVRVAIWDSWECTSEVCKAKCRFGVAFVCLFFPVANRVLFSNLRFWFFKAVGQHFMTQSDPKKLIFKLKRDIQLSQKVMYSNCLITFIKMPLHNFDLEVSLTVCASGD